MNEFGVTEYEVKGASNKALGAALKFAMNDERGRLIGYRGG
jgi:hypothetical protein